jgi:hypothetical protein
MSLDFLQIRERTAKKTKEDEAPGIEVYPDFVVGRITDLMTRGHSFYAVWDAGKNLWSTEEMDVQRLIDEELWAYRNKRSAETGRQVSINLMGEFSSGAWQKFQQYMKNIPDSSVQLDEALTFANTDVKKSDYASKRLSYSLEEGDHSAWDELVSTLYNPEEREKIEWLIGALVAGDGKHIQKMCVFYGAPGTGKSTIISIIADKLLNGYTSTFEAKALTGNNNSFATETFRDNPLLAIEHDGDLSQIKDYTKLNSIISHEMMTMNEKFKPSYQARILALLIIGTNSPVKISDAKAGIIRRLIDIHPSNRLLAPQKYQTLMAKIDFEVGAIAAHCLEVYRAHGRHFYDGYRAVEMMLQTDVFYNYIEHYFDVFKSQKGIALDQAYSMYKEYAADSGIEYKLPRHRFREELRNYFEEFEERAMVDGIRVRSWYSEFRFDKFRSVTKVEEDVLPLVMEETESLFDDLMADMPAQYTKGDDIPIDYWDNVTSTLAEIDTTRVHYVKVPENHIVIDFDLTDESGEKSAELNMKAASEWPPTYSEFSKGGGGIHLHYNYIGDVTDLARVYSEGIEIKVFTGKLSLRRRLSKCNNIPVASINGGLPLKEKKVINSQQVKSEKGLRDLLMRNLRKEIMPGTKPSVDFMNKILEDAYSSGIPYDVTDMKNMIIAFANGSTHQPLVAIKTAMNMKYKSENSEVTEQVDEFIPDDDRLAIFDVEVYPNLFHISWKYVGSDTIVHMTNPSPHEVEQLLRLKLVGFNNRRYDNHILYAASMGYSNEELYRLSQRIISGAPNALFGVAYNLSWVDIYDFAMTKQGLKKWEAELGLNHVEMDIPWDEPVPKELWDKVIAYCDNDVNATEEVFNYLSADYTARLILADISGLSVNETTVKHTSQIVFEGNRAPQSEFVYTDLSETFPGYVYNRGKSTYRDEEVGEGGLVREKVGMYTDVALYDVASMHPNSIIALNLFGDRYTKNFKDLVDARVAIKRKEFDRARKMYNGKLAPYLKDESQAKKLAYALKIAINIVYGMTSASFPNAFKDPRNKDNIVAKRGALFMMDLKVAVEEMGFEVIHIKTDSIKIPGATPEVWEFVKAFGAKYGYEFEHEATYSKFVLTTKADYVAKIGWTPDGDKVGTWTATGATMQRPYVFKTLFSKEPITFKDLCEIKSVTTKMYLDFTENYEEDSGVEKNLHFVGKVGEFVPIKEGRGGGLLVREKDDKFNAVSNTTGYRFMEATVVKELGKEDDIDMSYFRKYVDDAIAAISKHGDFEWFQS